MNSSAKKILISPWLHLALLTMVVLAIFNRTLGSYFLADDFGEVAYVSRIAGGDLGMLWANFSGNYMQIPSMSVWRPWLLVSLLADFIIWHANPFGFYLTNVLSYVACACALYWLMRNLTSNWCPTRSSLAAFFTALLFSASPLHCESVSWVVGRVDIVCALFYLLCLNFFILSMRAREGETKKWTIASLVFFWLAMWTKEMAIGAPVLALAIALLWGDKALDGKKSFKQALPLLASLPIYFILRYLALGTLLGGYTQGIGDAQAASALSHWLDADTARRLFFPLAYSLYGDEPFYPRLLTVIYTLLGGIAFLRLASLNAPPRWLVFWPLWLATALAPIYKLWGLGYELEGARFVFFATMPLAAFLPVLLFAPHSGGTVNKTGGEQYFRRALAAISICGLAALAFFMAKIAGKLNLEWVHAGKEVRSFAEQARSQTDGPGVPITLLGIPKRRGGAHMVLNGTTFKILLQPPIASRAYDDKFLTFDPIIFGEADYLNASRFKRALEKSGDRVFIWNGEKQRFDSVVMPGQAAKMPPLTLNLPATASAQNAASASLHSEGHARIRRQGADGAVAVEGITAGDGIDFADLDLARTTVDVMAITFKFKELPGAEPVFSCSWQAEEKASSPRVSATAARTLSEQTIYLPLSANFHWYEEPVVRHLFLQLPAGAKVELKAVRLYAADMVAPQLAFESAHQDSAIGVYSVSDDNADRLLKVSRPGQFPEARLVVDISKPNAFFENFSPSEQGQALQETLEVKDGKVLLPTLPAGANYEIRARALKDGKDLGLPSDPLVLRHK